MDVGQGKYFDSAVMNFLPGKIREECVIETKGRRPSLDAPAVSLCRITKAAPVPFFKA